LAAPGHGGMNDLRTGHDERIDFSKGIAMYGTIRGNQLRVLVRFVASLLALGAPAVQAEAPAETASSGPALEEVVVTAQRREEHLQDVPMAISAVTGEQITAQRITDLYTLATSVPWVNMTQDSAVSQQLNIRGIVSVKLNDASAEPSVGMFVDEVYVPRMGSAFTDFFDLERIEVIRGPQGVLLGKNVVGGALSVITAKPSFDTSGSATVSYGNYDSLMANGYLTGGLTDTLAARFSFQVRNHSGYNRNVLLDRELDDLQSYQARAQLLYQGSDGDLKANLSVDYGNDSSNGTIRAAIDDPAIAGTGTLQQYRDAHGLDKREDMSPEAEYVKRQSFGANLRIDWSGWDAATLTSISSYRNSEARWGYNQIGFDSPPAIVDTFVFQKEEPTTYSQELRLASNSENSHLDWIVGAYYQHDKILRPYQHDAATVGGPTVFSGHSFYDASAEISTSAVFGQLGYAFDNGLKFSAGVRYLHDDKSGRKEATCLADGGDGACVTPLRGPAGTHWIANYGETWDAVTGQGMIEYKLNDAVMFYGSVAQGFKGGGWDFIPPTPVAAEISFDPEHLTNYEIGMKSDFFDRRLRVNGAVFDMEYRDLQAQRTDLTCLCLITSNAGKAQIKGFELELAAAATEALTLNAAVTSLEPEYVDYDDKAGHVYDGNTMQRTPKLKYNLGGTYSVDLGGGDGNLQMRVNYTHQSKIYWGPDNVSYEPSYGLLDASVRVQPPGQKWNLTLWGKNLTDELYSQLGLPFLGDLVEVWGPPRTYGVDFTYPF
jgi:iron complex outermembrane receptor protein